jgi:ABC-type spermidine/putrescine transport system permease subunit II
MSIAFVVVVFLAAFTAATRQWRGRHQIFADIDDNHLIPNVVYALALLVLYVLHLEKQ